MTHPSLAQVLPAWDLYKALARRTHPPAALPPDEDLLPLERAFWEEPFPRLVEALRAWALERGHAPPPTPEARFGEEGEVELSVPSFRPYPFTVTFWEGRPLRFALRGRTLRHALRVYPKGVLFGREKGVPLTFLSRVDEIYAPVVLPLFRLHLPGGFLGEALRQGIRLDLGKGVFRQGDRYLHANLEGKRLQVWEAEAAVYQEQYLTGDEEMGQALHRVVLRWGPLYASLPQGPLAAAVREGDLDALAALRVFSQLLAQGYARALEASPEAAPALPRFLPDGRRLKATEEGLYAGKVRVPPPTASPPPDDPLLGMRAYWDNEALRLSGGLADLVPLSPKPLPTPRGPLAFTPSWAALLDTGEGDIYD